MKINVDIDLKKVANESFIPLFTDKNRYLLTRGGAGSGKSWAIAQKLLLRIIIGMNKGIVHRFLVLRKTSPAARKSVYPLFNHLINDWNLNSICKKNRTEMTFNFMNGSQIIITGLDDPEKIKSIFGITGVWLEEANEFKLDDFRQLDLRMRGEINDYYQVAMSFNPISMQSWVYTEFYENTKEHATLHHSTYRDNRFLDEEYKERLENLINEDATYYKIYTLGEWGSLEGLIYENIVLIDEFPDISNVIGGDFGWNVPSSLVRVGKDGSDLYIDELLYREKMTNQDLIRWINNNLDDDLTRRMYFDSAEPDRIQELVRGGVRGAYKASKGKNSVLDGIDFVKRHKIHITKSSDNVIKEIGGYKWKERSDEMVDEPVKYNDHSMDAMRYGVYSHWGKKGAELKILWL